MKVRDLVSKTFNRIILLGLNRNYESVIETISKELAASKKNKWLISKQDQDGKTPLDLAIESGSSNAVKLLLTKGAMNQAIEKDGYNAFHHCSR